MDSRTQDLPSSRRTPGAGAPRGQRLVPAARRVVSDPPDPTISARIGIGLLAFLIFCVVGFVSGLLYIGAVWGSLQGGVRRSNHLLGIASIVLLIGAAWLANRVRAGGFGSRVRRRAAFAWATTAVALGLALLLGAEWMSFNLLLAGGMAVLLGSTDACFVRVAPGGRLPFALSSAGAYGIGILLVWAAEEGARSDLLTFLACAAFLPILGTLQALALRSIEAPAADAPLDDGVQKVFE